jgi:hypothetical protein
MNDYNSMTNQQLIMLRNELARMVKQEQMSNVKKKGYLEAMSTSKRFANIRNAVTDIESKVLFAGNVNDINSIIWPFFFPSEMTEIAPDKNEVINIKVTQEAPFTLTEIIKVVFFDNEGTWKYLDPKSYDDNIQNGLAQGLKFTIVDAQSGRSWFDKPVSLDHIGDGKDPYELPSPVMVLPNSTLEIQLFNQSVNTYKVGIILKGYRIRVQDAANMLSLVTE